MGRSKELGKPVSELTPAQLVQEKARCENMIRVFGRGPAVKGLKKRLHQINKRMEREGQG
jgi:hypothetical protein